MGVDARPADLGSITFQSKTNLFSKVGIGARDAA